MKVLHLFSNNHKGNGVVEVIKSVVPRLTRSGIEVGIYSNKKYDSNIEQMVNDIADKYYYNKDSSKFNLNTLQIDVDDIKTYDLVHIHGVFNLKNMFLANKLTKLGIPYIITCHGNLMNKALKKSQTKKLVARKLVINKVINSASGLHVLANEEMYSIMRITKNNKFYVIPNGVESVNNISNSNRNVESFNIIFIGRIDVNHKGLDILVDAVSRNLSFLLQKKVKIHIVGYYSASEDEKYFDSKLKEIPMLKDIFVFHGAKYGEEKFDLLSKADLFIHPSRYEGMPIAVLEALTYGIPCIVTRDTNMADIITESSSGIVIDFDVNHLMNSLKDTVSMNKEELQRMGQKGKSYAIKKLSWDNIANQYIQMYQSVISYNRLSE